MPVFLKDDQAVLFVHVPRTGGSAVSRYLRNNGWTCRDLDEGSPFAPTNANFYRRVSPQHWSAEVLARVYRLERFNLVLQFSREPLERLRSEYLWRRNADPRAGRFTSLSFEAWWDEARASCQQDPQALDNHIRPQSDFLLPGAIVGRFENDLNARFFAEHSLTKAGLFAGRRLSKVNSSGPGDRVISDQLAGEIRAFYRFDYETFGYA